MEIRCKACDVELKDHEVFWREDISLWEDLCSKCLEAARYYMKRDPILTDKDGEYVEDEKEKEGL